MARTVPGTKQSEVFVVCIDQESFRALGGQIMADGLSLDPPPRPGGLLRLSTGVSSAAEASG